MPYQYLRCPKRKGHAIATVVCVALKCSDPRRASDFPLRYACGCKENIRQKKERGVEIK